MIETVDQQANGMPEHWHAFHAERELVAGEMTLTAGWWLLGYRRTSELSCCRIPPGGGVIEEPGAPLFALKIHATDEAATQFSKGRQPRPFWLEEIFARHVSAGMAGIVRGRTREELEDERRKFEAS